jgi:molybdate transport system substrate-binding protein
MAVVGMLLAGCASGPTERTPASAGAGGELTVLAAASLQSPFTRLGEVFEATFPGTTVTFGFAGSSDLVAQLQQGAPGDVLATADTATMGRAAADGLLSGAAQPFATNTMVIAVPAGNPAGIGAFADLAAPDVAVVVCAPQVPCGAATAQVEASTGVTLSPVSEEGSVTDVLGKVSTGQADAGVVYVTDVAAAGDAVEGIGIPPDANTTNSYPIAVLAASGAPELAGRFRDLVLGAQGREVLADAGFGAP